LGRGTVDPEGEGNSVESSEAPQHKRRLCIFGCAMFGQNFGASNERVRTRRASYASKCPMCL
jgi:hypothetical protein